MLYIILPTHDEPLDVRTEMYNATEREFPFARIIQVFDQHGEGKGSAIAYGINMIYENYKVYNTDIIAYIDGDGDIHPKELKRLLNLIIVNDIVVGTKDIKGLLSRRIITFLSRIYLNILFGIKVDTQTGIKAFRSYAIKVPKEKGFLFDIEMLYLARKDRHSIVEVPIEASITKRVSCRALIKTFIQSVKLFVKLRIL